MMMELSRKTSNSAAVKSPVGGFAGCGVNGGGGCGSGADGIDGVAAEDVVVAVDEEVVETCGKGVVGARGKSKAKLACDEEMDDAPAGEGGNGGKGS